MAVPIGTPLDSSEHPPGSGDLDRTPEEPEGRAMAKTPGQPGAPRKSQLYLVMVALEPSGP
eukprot:6485156-Pyramimonas_sp.AAC.1